MTVGVCQQPDRDGQPCHRRMVNDRTCGNYPFSVEVPARLGEPWQGCGSLPPDMGSVGNDGDGSSDEPPAQYWPFPAPRPVL